MLTPLFLLTTKIVNMENISLLKVCRFDNIHVLNIYYKCQ